MGFRFNYTEINELPLLAWSISLCSGSKVVEVLHGSWVEPFKDYFVEGAWAGDFSSGNIQIGDALMGSGAMIAEEQLIVCTPCHTLEAVYSVNINDTIFFSNSIPLILAVTGTRLDIDYLDYESNILSIADGLELYVKKVPLDNNSYLNVHYYENLYIKSDLSITVKLKQKPPDFCNFRDYQEYLAGSLKKISDNAAYTGRKRKFEPIVFCSNGYDSTACAVMGKEIGCNEAVVFETKRRYRSDSGIEIVKQLNYGTIYEKNEIDYLKTCCAEDFVSSGELGTSIYFAAAESELRGKILISGVHGDKVWDKNNKSTGPEIIRSFYPDTAKKEFRLRVGFIIVAIPFIGAVNHEQIAVISNSGEMRPWVLDNDYDRPIPRRIAEEKGIARNMFGWHKEGGAGSSLRFGNLGYLKKVMPPVSYEKFLKFYKRSKNQRNLPILHFLTRSFLYSIYSLLIFSKRYSKVNVEHIFRIFNFKKKYKCSPWAPSYLFLWGAETVQSRYLTALRNKTAKT